MEDFSTFSSMNSNFEASLTLSDQSSSSFGSKSSSPISQFTDKKETNEERLRILSILGKGA